MNRKTIEVCSNCEWLAQALFGFTDDYDPSAPADYASSLHSRLTDAGFDTIPARGQRCLYHGWNGANTFRHNFGVVATFDDLTPEEMETVENIICKCHSDTIADYDGITE